MASLMEMIKQTGKTIIFEKFNTDVKDLINILSYNLTKEQFVAKLNEELSVNNFKDFEERFSPAVYEKIIKDENGLPCFIYSFEKQEGENGIKLIDHPYYKMIMAMMDSKSSSGQVNLGFDYKDVLDTLTPKRIIEEAKQIRKNLYANHDEYLKLTEGGTKPSAEAQRYKKNVIECKKQIIRQYKNKSALALLPLAISDIDTKINSLPPSVNNDTSPKAISYCDFTFDEEGNLQAIEHKISDNAPLALEDKNKKAETALGQAIKNDFENYAPALMKTNDFLPNLILNVYTGRGANKNEPLDKLKEKKKFYQDVYVRSVESFAKSVTSVVEKFAGVKSFFEHASLNGKLAPDTSVIIANCSVSEIIRNKEAKSAFEKYFNDLSSEKDKERIWFAVIPSVLSLDSTDLVTEDNIEDEDIYSPTKFDDDDNLNKEGTSEGFTTIANAKEMAKILTKAKIMAFISYKGSKNTDFMSLTAEKVRKYRDDFISLNSEYSVFAYPNFTILPEERATAEIDVDCYIQIPGSYIDAAYVASGIIVGTQNYRILEASGFKVDKNYPCVRFDIEKNDNYKKFPTKINRQTMTEREKETENEITSDCFGFVFADNKIVYNNSYIQNCYVFLARTLAKGKNNLFKSIYKTLVKNFIDQIVRIHYDKPTTEDINKFINTYVRSWKLEIKEYRKEDNLINLILHEGDDITLEDKELMIWFNKEADIIGDLVISTK